MIGTRSLLDAKKSGELCPHLEPSTYPCSRAWMGAPRARRARSPRGTSDRVDWTGYVVGQCRYGPQIGPQLPPELLRERGPLGRIFRP